MNTLYDLADALLATLTPYRSAADATFKPSYCPPPISAGVLRMTARNLLFEMRLSAADRFFAYQVIDKVCMRMLDKESQLTFPGKKDCHE